MSLDVNILRNIVNQEPLEYHDPSHAYKISGNTVPSVTTVAGEMLKVEGLGDSAKFDPLKAALMDASTLKGASERGTRVHKVVEEYIKKRKGLDHELDVATEALQSPDEHKAFQTFLELESRAGNVEYLHSELQMGLKDFNGTGHGLAGTMDILAIVNGTPEIWDIKAGQEVPETVGEQTAAYEHMIRENTGYKGQINRRVAHIPAKGKNVGDIEYTHKQWKQNEHIKDTDLDGFTTKLSNHAKTGGQRVVKREEVVSGLSNRIKVNKDNFLSGKDLFGWIDGGLPEEEAKNLMGIYFDAAKEAEMGVKATLTKKGVILGLSKTQNDKLRDAIIEKSFRKKEQPLGWYGNLKASYEELKSVGEIEVGDTLEATKGISGKVGTDLMSVLSRTDNIKYAAVGAAAGYAGGLLYGAMHDTSDPTSTYQEDKHILGNAVKGAVAGSAATYAAAAAMNLRNVESGAGDMVAHVGTSARGFVKGATSVIMNAWKATGRMK